MDTCKKLISIIIPCFNVELYLDRCIKTLVKQSIGIDKLELIFVNDASTDSTLSILYRYESRYPDSIIVVDLPYNIRQGGARNVGLQYATGSYIGYVDADDWIELDMYKYLYNTAVRYKCELVTCKFIRDFGNSEIDEGDTTQGVLHVIETIDDRKELIVNGIEGGICTQLIKREFLIDNEIYFPENIAYEDNFFATLILCYIRSFYSLDITLYHYFVNYNSTSLKQNDIKHFDRLKVEVGLLEELRNRGLFTIYASEIEYNFLKIFYINTLHLMFVRFDKPIYDMYLIMKNLVVNNFPQCYENYYLKEWEKQWINTIYDPLTEEGFLLLYKQYKKIIE